VNRPLRGENRLAAIQCDPGRPRSIFCARMEQIQDNRRAIVSHHVVEIAVREARQTPQKLPGSVELGASLEDDRIEITEHLKRNAEGNPGAAWIPAIVQVIPVIGVRDVNVIAFVPIVSPEFRIRIDDAEPIAAVLETRIPANVHKGEAVDSERVT